MSSEGSKRKGQAAIYDGITFLLLVSFSSSLVYVFVATYGQTEDSALKAGYQLNYLQSVTKTFYYLDASALQHVDATEPSANELITIQVYANPPSLSGDKGCSALAPYKYSLADLLKRDLADPETQTPGELVPLLDDKFGPIEALGRQGARCAMKELMKPLVYSGYEYAVDVINPKATLGSNFIDVAQEANLVTARITNNERLSNQLQKSELLKGDYENGQCVWVQKQDIPLLSMAAPFRILLPEASQDKPQTRDYELRFCIWFKQTKAQTA